jgi:hypothetical protein
MYPHPSSFFKAPRLTEPRKGTDGSELETSDRCAFLVALLGPFSRTSTARSLVYDIIQEFPILIDEIIGT